MPAIRLDIQDAAELTEMLQFIKDWITGSDDAKASFAHFVGSPGYDVADLCADIDKFAFLLGGNDGEHLLT
jgi:hypothetical protein